MRTSLDDIQTFLKSRSRPFTAEEARGLKPFVTVSRQAGTGARRFAEALLRELEASRESELHGWSVFDSALFARLLDDPKLRVSLRGLADEAFHGEVEDYVNRLVAGTTPQRLVYRRLFETVRTLAAAGKAVLIGRAGCLLTRDLPGGVHVRLVGGRPGRIDRTMRRRGVARPEAESLMDELDSSRARLLRSYFHRDIDDPMLYDCVWNLDAVPVEAAARATALLAREKLSAPRARAANRVPQAR